MELQQLLKECKAGSITAQKYLFDKYATCFFLLCRRYLKTDEHAEETMMGGFLKIFQSLGLFDYVNDAAAFGWMKRIMVNECLMELRKKNSFLLVAESSANDIAVDEDALSQMAADEIYQLITQLPIGYRTVFNLFVMEQMGHKEIAASLNITEGTSKSQLSKARNMLQQLLQQQNEVYAQVR
jgi:RNA polymerase sigma factor (sigma-70 family)